MATHIASLATKADLAQTENKLTGRMGTMLAVAIGVLLAVLPMLMRK